MLCKIKPVLTINEKANRTLMFAAKELQKYNYDKWVLIEHDTHLRAPELDLNVSADILKGLFA